MLGEVEHGVEHLQRPGERRPDQLRGHADYLHRRGGHYLLIVKANQPTLHAQLVVLPWRQIPVAATDHDRGHGRVETRQLKICAVGAGIGFPHARLAVVIRRRRRPLDSATETSETVYAITSLSWRNARPDLLAEAIRRHWRIENQLHWIRDVTFGEDLSQARTANGPAVMATLRNFAVKPPPPRRRGQHRSRLSPPRPPPQPRPRPAHNCRINYAGTLTLTPIGTATHGVAQPALVPA
jgi:hypothetical protein